MGSPGDRIAEVRWLDAQRDDGTPSVVAGPIGVLRRTVGWVLRDDEHGVVLAFSKDADEFERTFSVPRAYIRKVRYLK